MALFFTAALICAGVLYGETSVGGATTRAGVLGGPAFVSAPQERVSQSQALGLAPIVPLTSQNAVSAEHDFGNGFFSGSVADSGQPIGPAFNRADLISYKVQKGDTLAGIAAYFGISLDTLIGSNPSIKSGIIRPGDDLNVLPVSGIVYKTTEGDTLESVAASFGIPESGIVQFNKPVNFSNLGAGIPLVIPGAKKTAYRGSKLPDLKAYFSKPAEGLNWGKLHPVNAVDIANSCGTPVLAAAEGLVIPDEKLGDGRGGWNGGYGNFVLIEHPFGDGVKIGDGVKTRYAHLKEILVDIGDYVKQGEEIATMGETGEATGCHVHFGVEGTENPFVE